MLIFIGLLLLIAVIGIHFFGKNLPNGVLPSVLEKTQVKLSMLAFAVIMLLSDGLFFVAKPGTAYALQYVWGGDKAVTSQGLKLQWFGRTIPISFEIAFQDTLGDVANQDEIYYRTAEWREFSDAIKAQVATSLVIGVDYQDEETFLGMADKNRSEGKLVHARVIPIYDQVLKNTCKLQTAQDYIAGASTQFDYYLRDQLQHGMYLTEEIQVEDTETVIGDSTRRTVTSKGGNTRKVKRYKIRIGKDGQPLRDEGNSLKAYGLSVRQAAVTQVNWEDAFDRRLDAQKDQVAQTQLKKQEAEKYYYEKLSEEQKGEKDKVAEQKKLEKEQIQLTIAAETAVKVAKYQEEEQTNLLAASRKASERIKVEADANSYKNRQMVSAGLTPQEKAEWEYKIAVGVAEKLAGPEGLVLPQVYIPGGDGGKGNDDLISKLLGAELAKQMLNKKNP